MTTTAKSLEQIAQDNSKPDYPINAELLKARNLDKYHPFEEMLGLSGDESRDEAIINKMNKQEQFMKMAVYSAINCLEYFAKYKSQILRLDVVLQVLLKTNETQELSNEEKIARFMKAYDLNVDSTLEYVKLFEMPLFYLAAISTTDENVINMLLEQKPNLEAKVMQGSNVWCNNIEECFAYFGKQEAIPIIEHNRRLISQWAIKTERRQLNEQMAHVSSTESMSPAGVHKI